MFTLTPATRIFLASGATDMRKGYDRLYGLVRHSLQEDPKSGHLFCFCNRPRTRLKVLYWDQSGLWVCSKRLEKGTFAWPERKPTAGAATEIDSARLLLLLGGLDLRQVKERAWFGREKAAEKTAK